MKKIILLFLLFIVQVILYAQENNYIPFVEEGKVWNMRYQNDEGYLYPDYEYSYYIEGDTLVSCINCKKLYTYNENDDGLTEYKMALYETERKVYFIPSGSTESYILYDFQIPEGTSSVVSNPIHPEWELEMRNNKNGMTKTNGISRHCLFVNRVYDSFEDFPSGWWIEGIGSELGPLNTWGFGATGNPSYFLNCEVNGEAVFNVSDFYSNYTSVNRVHIWQAQKNTIFDLQGRRVSNPKKGIYIEDGRKVLIK